MLRPMLRVWLLCLLGLLGACGTTAAVKRGSAEPTAPEVTGPARQPEGFAEEQSAPYRDLSPDSRVCTLRHTARAGARWLGLVSGKDLSKTPAAEQLALVAPAVRGDEEISDGELADLGWLVAERLRTHLRGSYRWDPEHNQLALVVEGETILPMELIAAAKGGKESLAKIGGRIAGRKGDDAIDCRDVPVLDLLEARALQRRRFRR